MTTTIRERIEAIENRNMSPFGTRSAETKGRKRFETLDDTRTCFRRDADRIIHSNTFQREKDKTQVIIGAFVNKCDHYRTRMTHSLEVAQVGRTIARALMLNEDLIEAAALGHDLGHTPFGHTGEKTLNTIFPFKFNHTEHSIRVVEELEKNGKGLNLCYETLDAIRNHSGLSNNPKAITPEGQILPFADKIAYLTSDFHDAIDFGVIGENDLPPELKEIFGSGKTKAMGILVDAVIQGSLGLPNIKMESSVYNAMAEFRKWMFNNVYFSDPMEEQRVKATAIVERLCEYYKKFPEDMYKSGAYRSGNTERDICDFVAGMTDKFAISTHKKLGLG